MSSSQVPQLTCCLSDDGDCDDVNEERNGDCDDDDDVVYDDDGGDIVGTNWKGNTKRGGSRCEPSAAAICFLARCGDDQDDDGDGDGDGDGDDQDEDS